MWVCKVSNIFLKNNYKKNTGLRTNNAKKILMITYFKSKTKLFSTTYLLSNTTKDLKVMFTRIDIHPQTFIRKCKVNLPTLKFDILRRGKKLRNDPLFSLLRSSHYFVNCQNRTTDFMVLCLVFYTKCSNRKKKNKNFTIF